MGYMRHHAIVVTSWDETALENAHVIAKATGAQVSDVVDGDTNSYRSFLVAPDGSKEGWEESDQGNERRNTFIDWLESQRYGDGSTALNYAEVRFGDDEGEASLTRASDFKLTMGGPE